MSISKGVNSFLGNQWAVIGVVGIVAFLVIKNAIAKIPQAAGEAIKGAADAIGTGATNVAEDVGGLATGQSTIKPGAQANAAAGVGKSLIDLALSPFAFVGGLADAALGTHRNYDPAASQVSSSQQHTSGSPFTGGPTAAYDEVLDDSSKSATDVASPFATGNLASVTGQVQPVFNLQPDFGINTPSTW